MCYTNAMRKVGYDMITLFNRQELYTTYKVDDLARIRQILEANNINYKLRTVGQIGTSSMPMGRSRSIPVSSSFGSTQFIIYVHSSDLEYASYLIRK